MDVKKFVIEIKEDICVKNDCLDKVPELLKVLPHYGTLTPYDTAVQSIVDEKQSIIDNLTDELGKLKSHNLSAEEIQLLNVLRAIDVKKGEKRENEWKQEKAQLEAAKAESDNKVEGLKTEFRNYKRRIRSMVGDDDVE